MLDFSVNSILIDQLEKGNEKAFSFLVENYNHKLCVYANSLMNDPVKAQDIVQNVFIKTYRSAKSLMALEKLYMDTLVKFEMEPEQQGTEEIMEKVMIAINDLPPKCQQIFLLSKKEGLDNIEIAEYLEISRKTVENQITKAFTILREKLGKKYETVLMLIFGINTKKIL